MKHFTGYVITVLIPFLYSINHYNINWTDCLGILGGLFIWSLAEYVFHRFAFHNNRLGSKARKFLVYNHLKHHRHPENTKNLFLPLRLTLPIAILVCLVVSLLFSFPFTTFVLIGLFIGLAYYEFVHYQAHNRMYNVWPLNYLTRRHLKHHYENEDRMFGVTSPLFDWMFKTK